jgi:phosphoribosyl-AMP cyclohydrolase
MAASKEFPLPLTSPDVEKSVVFAPRFGVDGLIPAIATDHATGEALMFAWMNAKALLLTIETGKAHFWSRSRSSLWLKGEESGNFLSVKEIRTDCDQDVIWLRVVVEGAGKACHTGARTCFYRVVRPTDAATGMPIALERIEDC